MKRLIEFFVRNHVFADLLTVVVLVFGIYALTNIRRIVFPNVNFDVITITTFYPGATPQEVEKLITSPIEQDLKEVDGIKKLTSTSIENMSTIIIYLDPDQTTEEEAKADIKDVIDKLEDLPEEAEDPKVVALETKNEPIIEVALYGEMERILLRNYAKEMEEELEKISGVSKVSLRGEQDLEIWVEADQKKLSRYRVTLNEMISALKAQNVSIPAGTVEADKKERIVRVVGDFNSIEDIKKTVVRANELGRSILISDLAQVRYALEEPSVINRVNGIQAISLTVAKKEDADAIDVVDLVKDRVAEVKAKMDPGLKIEFVNDFSYYIKNRLDLITSNLLIGLGCVLLLLPMLLPFRFAFLVALGEPFAFLGAILVLYWTGFSINLISMIGLIIVSGILVDDSIVVTENAVRRIESGEDPKVAAVKGTMQIFGPLTASVFTTAVVFLPMAFMSGIFGKFIYQIPLAVLTCLVVSLFETYFILPAHIAHWIKAKPKDQQHNKNKNIFSFFTQASESSINFWTREIESRYETILRKFIAHRYLVLCGVAVFFLISSVAGYFYIQTRFILFPPDGVEIFFIRTEAQNGTKLDRHGELLKPIEKLVAELPKQEVLNFVTNIGIQQQDPHDPFTRRGSEYAQIAVYLTPENERDRTAQEIIDSLRSKTQDTKNFVKITYDRINPGPPTGKAVSLGVRGKDFETIMVAVEAIKKELAKIEGVADIADSYLLGKEEIRIRVDSEQAAAAGLSVASIGYTVRAAFEGHIATTLKTLDDDQDIRVTLPEYQTNDQDIFNKLYIPNPMGNLIPLNQVSSLDKGQGLLMVQHEANERQVNVTAGVDTEITSSFAVNNQLREILPSLNKRFPEVSVAFGGEDEDTQESFESLGKTFLVALAGVYLILVLTFGNLYQPLVVMLTVPLGLVSVLWAFISHGLPISFMGCLGAVALVGVIVNNAIVLVDFINQNLKETHDFKDGVVKASKNRLRPIFLTTVTTVIGVLPTAYGLGGLDKFIVPIAMSLAWGLMFGALLTAFIFPPTFVILEDLRNLFRFKKRAQT